MDGPALGEGRGCLGFRGPWAGIAGSKAPAARVSQAAVPVLARLKISRNSRKKKKLLFFCKRPDKAVESLLYRPGTSGLVPSWAGLSVGHPEHPAPWIEHLPHVVAHSMWAVL